MFLFLPDVKESAKEKASGAKEYVEETGSNIAEKGRGECLFPRGVKWYSCLDEGLNDIQLPVSDTAKSAKDMASRGMESAKDMASRGVESAKETGSKAADKGHGE